MINEVYIIEAEKLYSFKDNEIELRKYIEGNLNLEVFTEEVIKQIIELLRTDKNRNFTIGKISGFISIL